MSQEKQADEEKKNVTELDEVTTAMESLSLAGERPKSIVFLDFGTTGSPPSDNILQQKLLNNPKNPKQILAVFQGMLYPFEQEEFPLVTEIALLSVLVEDFEQKVEKMKDAFGKVEPLIETIEDLKEELAKEKKAAGNHENKMDIISRELEEKEYQLSQLPNIRQKIPFDCLNLVLNTNHPEGADLSSDALRLTTVHKDEGKFPHPEKRKTFGESWEQIKLFLGNVPKPSVLVAHNGLDFDFRVLYGELKRYNLLDDAKILEQFFIVDSMVAFKAIDDTFKNEVSNSRPKAEDKNPSDIWKIIESGVESVALRKRYRRNLKKYSPKEFQSSGYRFEGYKNEDLYKEIIGGPDLDFHYSLEDCKATLQLCLAYGQKFLDYVKESAAPFVFGLPILHYIKSNIVIEQFRTNPVSINLLDNQNYEDEKDFPSRLLGPNSSEQNGTTRYYVFPGPEFSAILQTKLTPKTIKTHFLGCKAPGYMQDILKNFEITEEQYSASPWKEELDKCLQ